MDISAISGAYTAIKTVKDMATYLLEAKIDKEAEKRVNEVLAQVGTVQDTLFYIREELLRLQDENRELREANRKLEEKLATRERVIYEKPSYWIVNDSDKDGPFCQKCYDSEQKLIRLQGGNNDFWTCHECKGDFKGPNYKRPSSGVARGNGGWMSS